MNLAALSDLKRQMMTAPDYAAVMHTFMDVFGEEDEFFSLGRRTREPLLEQVMKLAAEQALARPVTLRRVTLIEIPEHAFVHGALNVNDSMAMVLFFRDVFTGVMSIANPFVSDNVQFIRFGGKILPMRPVGERN